MRQLRALLKLIRLLLIVLIIFFVSGCFDDEDIDRRMIVSPMGIDAAPNGKMMVTIRFPLVRPGGPLYASSTSSCSKSYTLRFSTSDGILPAIIDVQNRDEHSVFLGQCTAIVFGEDYAKHGLKPALDFLYRFPPIPVSAYIVIARPTAAKLLEINWSEQEQHDQNIRFFFRNRENQKYALKLWSLFQKTYSRLDDPLIPIVTPSDDSTTIKLVGMAIVKNDKMVDELNSEETMLIGLMKAPTQKNRLFIPAPGVIATGFEVVNGHYQIKVSYRNQYPLFYLQFNYHAYLTELGKYQPPLNNHQVQRIEKSARQYLTKHFTDILYKLRAAQSDPLELANQFRVQQPKRFSLTQWPWNYQHAEFKVKVHFFIERLGVLK